VLEGGGPFVVGAGHRVPCDLLLEGRLPYTALAQRGQHLRDVGEEGPVGSEDEQSAAADALRVGVEKVGGPVQSDGGFPGARGALHAHRNGQVPSYEIVLIGLDGRGDVPHGADPGPLDLPGDDVTGPRLPPAEVLVLQPGEVGGVAPAAGRPAEPPPHGDALRVMGAGLVEGAGDGRPPVDDEGRGGRVLADPEPTDVVALTGVVSALEVQPPEEQGAFGQLPHLLGPTAQPVPENFGVGTGGGDVLAGDDLFPGPVDHGGEGGAAEVVVGAFPVEGVLLGGVG
jgi:hypothetical protein